MDQKRGLIIYDFDDVIANSEVLANAELAEIVTELGVATTLEEAYRLYMGKRFADVIPAIEASVGNPSRWICRLLSGAHAGAVPVGPVRRCGRSRAHFGVPDTAK
jgi:beta-phosphoglucomutase-like phosphatase (HAD superfamily)